MYCISLIEIPTFLSFSEGRRRLDKNSMIQIKTIDTMEVPYEVRKWFQEKYRHPLNNYFSFFIFNE